MTFRRLRNMVGSEAIVCGAIAVLYLLVWPVGEYSFNDDWAYVKSLEHLHFEGRLRVVDCVTTSLIGQLLWGLAFTKVFGFSFTVTKVSVVVLHALECVALLRILGLCGVQRLPALCGVLALALNPLHVANAFSFMTDVPALAFQVVAVFCYVKGIAQGEESRGRLGEIRGLTAPARQGDSLREIAWLGAGSLAASEAFLIRQHGILVPAAFCAYLALFDRRRLTTARLTAALLPVALSVATLAVYQRTSGRPLGYSTALPATLQFIRHPPWEYVPYILFTFVIYAGWLLIPLAGAIRPPSLLPRSPAALVLLGGLALAGVNGLLFYGLDAGRVFPYAWNMVTPFGLLRPDEQVIGARDMLWGKGVGWLISGASLLAALAFASRLLCSREDDDPEGSTSGERAQPQPASAGSPLKKGTVPPGGPDMSRDSQSAERDSPLFQRAAGCRYSDEPAPRPPAQGLRIAGRRLFGILLAMQTAYLFVTAPILCDRHLLLYGPSGIALFCLCLGGSHRISLIRYGLCLAPLAIYAVASTHDLHALSRTAFLAGQELVDRGVDPRTINAGYNFDGWSTYELTTQHRAAPPVRWWERNPWALFLADQEDLDPAARARRAWWPGLTSVSTANTYLVGCSPGPDAPAAAGYVTERVFYYRNWWPWKINSVAVYREASR